MWRAVLLCTFFLLFFQSAQARERDPACIDKAGNRNGRIDTDAEIVAYALHSDESYRLQDTNCDGVLSAEEARVYNAFKRSEARLAINDAERRRSAGEVVIVPPPPKPVPTVQQVAGSWLQGEGSGKVYLRRDFQDMRSFIAIDTKGDGAAFQFTSDQLADNRAFAANGVVAVPYIFDHTYDETFRTGPYIAAIAFAPSVRFDYLRNSNPKLQGKNIEVVTPGISGEIELANFYGFSHFISGKASVVSSMGRAESWQFRGEWLPVHNPIAKDDCLSTSCRVFGFPLVYRFTPTFVAEYAKATAGSDLASSLLFVDRTEAFRLGTALKLDVFPNGLRLDELSAFMRYSHFSTRYSWYNDVISHRSYYLSDTTLTFNTDESESVGVVLGYRRGFVENTAQRVDVGTLGLAVKF